ncbi:RNA polymerase sigma factor [Pseudonocardia sp. TRM90224]|uniref:RNA polymerase sigma factor n=1 Tax=Pseudonocardia sp. TRM90224 TaxID=2812678 RepID=UPI001E3F20D3|nr:sigma-70 family RNA polymerase sigma factor [Pseudonocardia sp. TRM90224]
MFTTLMAPRSAYSTMTTTELVRAARDHDGRAWRELVARYQPVVSGTVAAHRLAEVDAADAIQNTWLRAVEALGSIREPEKMGGWLRTTAVHECFAILRRMKKDKSCEALIDDIASDAPDPEAVLLRNEVRGILDAAVNRLSGRERALIHTLFYSPDPRYEEMSRSMGLPIGSIGPTRQRALRRMRNDRELCTYRF